MERIKLGLYAVTIACYVAAGGIDVAMGLRAGRPGDVKTGLIALGFAASNGLIFFWRP